MDIRIFKNLPLRKLDLENLYKEKNGREAP